MSRSIKKPPFCAPHVLRLVNKAIAQNKLNSIINIHSRSSVILNKFIGLTFGVYNGKTYVPVKVNDNMVGRKFGEFSPTRRYTGHVGDKKVSRK
ncbi:ribosomal protein S19 [Ehrlichia chaffeensis str. Heartland]|uniref:Small ribosomal subunit protein uS19 n=1 Tax=Ehrlichia chaffeensis (strain ATCC CRL-10679 / Arkansas) TaxID=205920 RepID=RS19_EHRCR|nr:30S ribosomal protein S19 [Ehrlichia chaffeensis]Q2GH52.1 RecName: Full=Small ribosomal subunit protein uS19; AltName: Full=30S ribosomal protein S19 [Ehrlichia chaffeensis str. Arkansas]ABD45231.1 ribosomal protein S19 [Ehrlichia chaffeensis str. Arkansas]AHX03515.1 ribosomal protein S19 [Ehrlichia chaffeensis str. Heartland]AHX05764.1 ribosomal protein S19 [Ehrlichia chaffeensis str. Jax]AHX06756.1 ribosomal protein S19 [Ehrlichia chaffeensis str. Liberty]AHX07182.1 ribosomal protein S19